MRLSSIFVFSLLLALSLSSPSNPNPNEIIRESINNAAGMDLIPKDAKFKLTEFQGKTASDSISSPNGSGHVSGYVYTGKLAAGAGSNNKPNSSFALLFLAAVTIFPFLGNHYLSTIFC